MLSFRYQMQNLAICSDLCSLLLQSSFMKNRSSNVEPYQNTAGKTRKDKTGLTPRELIRYHINNPDEPIRDEDIENLVLNTVPQFQYFR